MRAQQCQENRGQQNEQRRERERGEWENERFKIILNTLTIDPSILYIGLQ